MKVGDRVQYLDEDAPTAFDEGEQPTFWRGTVIRRSLAGYIGGRLGYQERARGPARTLLAAHG